MMEVQFKENHRLILALSFAQLLKDTNTLITVSLKKMCFFPFERHFLISIRKKRNITSELQPVLYTYI